MYFIGMFKEGEICFIVNVIVFYLLYIMIIVVNIRNKFWIMIFKILFFLLDNFLFKIVMVRCVFCFIIYVEDNIVN